MTILILRKWLRPRGPFLDVIESDKGIGCKRNVCDTARNEKWGFEIVVLLSHSIYVNVISARLTFVEM